MGADATTGTLDEAAGEDEEEVEVGLEVEVELEVSAELEGVEAGLLVEAAGVVGVGVELVAGVVGGTSRVRKSEIELTCISVMTSPKIGAITFTDGHSTQG